MTTAAEILADMQREIEREEDRLLQIKADTSASIERNAVAWSTWDRWLHGPQSTRGPKPSQPLLSRRQAADTATRLVADAARAVLCAEMRRDGAMRMADRLGLG